MSRGQPGHRSVPRVLQFTPGFRFGGIEALLMGLYRCLDKSELQFDFVVDTMDAIPEFDEIRAAGGRVFQMGRLLDAPLRYHRKLRRIFKDYEGEYVAVHCHTVIRGLPVLWEAKRAGVRQRIVHSHTDSLEGADHNKARLAPAISAVTLPLATELCACSSAAGEFSFGNRPFQVFPNTIRTPLFAYDRAAGEAVRDELGIPRDAIVVGHTGRFTYQKNHEFLIAAFAEYKALEPKAHLILVGNGPLMEPARVQAKELGVEDSITFAGLQADVPPFLSAMDLFILPSHFEGFCISLLEAQANGLPSLAASVIYEEVQLTDSVHLCDLEDGPRVWGERLHAIAKGGRDDSEENCRRITDAGFDTESQVRTLVDRYYLR